MSTQSTDGSVATHPQQVRLLRGAHLADGRRVDVVVDGDRVAQVLPAGTAAASLDAAGPGLDLDLHGWLLLPAPAEPHAHLDKARSWDLIQPPMGDLARAIDSWRTYAATMTTSDVAARARAQLLASVAQGTTAVRSHVDVLEGDEPLRAVHALVQVRAELADVVDLELVALVGPHVGTAALEAALDAGVDAVGGAPHLADDPEADLRRLLAVAERRGCPVDLHTDEGLSGVPTLDLLARIVRGWPQNVSAGHCVLLGALPPEQRDAVVADVVASDVGIIANPITNLYLQGWEHPVATPRGLTALRALLDAGARVAAGADNVRDPFNPLGRGDALETAMLLVVAGHLSAEEAYAAVSTGARQVMGLPAAGVAPGAKAELLAVRAGSLLDAIATAPADRLVLHAGRLVSRTHLAVDVDPARAARPTAPASPHGPAPAGAPTTRDEVMA